MSMDRPYNPNVMEQMSQGAPVGKHDRAQLKLGIDAPFPWVTPPAAEAFPGRADYRSGVPELGMATNGVGQAITKWRLGRAVGSAEKLASKIDGRMHVADRIETPKAGWTGYNKPGNPIRPTGLFERRTANQMERITLRRRENAQHVGHLMMGMPKPDESLTIGETINSWKVKAAVRAREARDGYLGARFDWKADTPILSRRLDAKERKIGRLQGQMH